ncbi:hypothetical protein [Nonomuraea pusilla]|uniref:Uncharacterized protein n=1 Tax=Nonomuraea pusilla TaxID=46177 RepID=A0A1H7MTL9_9ACTN|nr:hypothetical protein [Nonomuraea pusilla]SEL14148.1 hypothetical protein SAMN05660976_01799 [Nonomuraea pusilla]
MAETVHISWDAQGVARGIRVTSTLGFSYTYSIQYDQRGAQVHVNGKKLVATAGYVAELECYRFTAVGFRPDRKLSEARWRTLADAAAGAAHAHTKRSNEEAAAVIAAVI